MGCEEYGASTTGQKHQDAVSTLLSHSMCPSHTGAPEEYRHCKSLSLVTSDIEERQISRSSDFMHVRVSSILRRISESFPQWHQLMNRDRRRNRPHRPLWPKMVTSGGASTMISEACILVLFQLISRPSADDSSFMISRAKMRTSNISAITETSSAKSRSVNTSWLPNLRSLGERIDCCLLLDYY